ncbi:hypothetical protein M9458_031081, partial [Cirrhinus mrigala]
VFDALQDVRNNEKTEHRLVQFEPQGESGQPDAAGNGLYTDAEFPVQNMPIQTDVVWKRPK